MQIESVTALDFGPLHGQTLELAPGLTVVAGPNESGKSSWHAATYAALCGRRRGRGAVRVEERRLFERHRPWDGGAWQVSARIVLADGRRIEIMQELEGKVDCRATDRDLGRDVSAEIMHEGAPDASRWLALDRRSFAATASVVQADLLGVLDRAEGLQEHIARAAATAGTQETAAGALDALARFRSEHVGARRPGSAKPLQRALDDVVRAESALSAAQAKHEQLADLRAAIAVSLEQSMIEDADLRRAVAHTDAMATLVEATRRVSLAQMAADAGRLRAHGLAQELDREGFRHARVRELTVDGAQVSSSPVPTRSWAYVLPATALLLGLIGLLTIVAGRSAVGSAVLLGCALAMATHLRRARGSGRLVAEQDVGRRIDDGLRAALLAGDSPDELEDSVSRLHERHRAALQLALRLEQEAAQAARHRAECAAVAACATDSLDADDGPDELGSRLDEAHAALSRADVGAQHARIALARLEGAHRELTTNVPEVVLLEEHLESVRAELARIQELADTIDLTAGLLRGAADRVHRDMAPVLAGTLTQWLPQVTAGRYLEAALDPATLMVQVRGAASQRWRPAALLSQGATEQIYLLLRMALAAHLSGPTEPCPLLLDDITAHADTERTIAICELLLSVAQERQVVLFAAQDVVRDWARERLNGSTIHAVRPLRTVQTD